MKRVSLFQGITTEVEEEVEEGGDMDLEDIKAGIFVGVPAASVGIPGARTIEVLSLPHIDDGNKLYAGWMGIMGIIISLNSLFDVSGQRGITMWSFETGIRWEFSIISPFPNWLHKYQICC